MNEKKNNRLLIQILTYLIKIFFSALRDINLNRYKLKMNFRAIRANKSGFVEADSHLSGSSNFIVDFTFSPLPSVKIASSSSLLCPRHLLQSSCGGQNHSRYATNPNTITAIPPSRENLRLSVLDFSNNYLQVSLIPEDRQGIPQRSLLSRRKL